MLIEDHDFAAVELRSMRAAWNSLARRWELVERERADLFPAGGEAGGDLSADTERRMRILIEIGYRISLPDGMLCDWLRTPTPVLGWLTPLDAMSGTVADLRGVRRLVEMGFAS